ncbi:MAG: ABC transporter permease [Planctomycetes bacterium]|nr:ABC transporter permease [Planctomycetota bacterium]
MPAPGSRLARLLFPLAILREIAISTGPILRRELLSFLRTPKAWRITLITVGAASLLPLFAWPSPGEPMAYFRAQAAFVTYSVVLYIALFLFVPLVTGSAITIERERETYELLYNTRIRPAGIVFGKLFASIAFFLLLILLTFPMVSILYLLGGFEVWDFIKALLGYLLFTAILGVIGLWSSMRHQRTSRAILEAFGILIALYFGLSICTSFLMVFFMTVWRGVAPPNLILILSWILTIGVPALLVLWMMYSLLRSARYPELAASRREERRKLKQAALGTTPPVSRTWLTRQLLDRTVNGIPDGWNPVLVASVRSQVYGAAHSRRMMFWGLAVLIFIISGMIFWFFLSGMGVESYVSFSIGAHVLLYSVALILPGLAATGLSGEVESGNLDFLRGTLLAPFAILRGKWLAALFGISGLWILGGLFGAAHLPFLLVKNLGLLIPIYFLAALLLVSLAASSAGILASTLARSTVSALVLAYLLSFGYLLGVPVLLQFFAFWARFWRFNSAYFPSLSPLWEFSQIISTQGFRATKAAVEAHFSFFLSLVVAAVVSAVQLKLAAAFYKNRWERDR